MLIEGERCDAGRDNDDDEADSEEDESSNGMYYNDSNSFHDHALSCYW